MSTLFSILLPTYKRSFLKECIDSVLAQSYASWELIIVNDASPEDIRSIVEMYTDPRIHYYENQHNIGARRLVKQWNYCLSLASGEYVICMGDDDKLMPNCLATYAELIARYPEVSVLHGQTDIIDAKSQLVCHTKARPEWESAMSLFFNRTFTYRHQFIGDFCYKRSDLLSAGGFYDLPYAWGSDDITAIRAAEAQGIANTQQVVFLYRDNEGTITRHSHTFGKLHAIALATCWKIRYLRRPTHDEVDEEYRKTLCRNVLRVALKKAYYALYHSIKKRS